MENLPNAPTLFKPNWKWLVVATLVVGCVMIWLGRPARPVFLGCLLGVLARFLIKGRGETDSP